MCSLGKGRKSAWSCDQDKDVVAEKSYDGEEIQNLVTLVGFRGEKETILFQTWKALKKSPQIVGI